jgi:cytochrome P450
MRAGFPVGAAVTLEELESDPHPVLARLREQEPVSWLPALDAWVVTRRDLVLQAMRDARTFTVDDPRFSTAQVVGPSMLSLDGEQHRRQRDPFAAPFRLDAVRARFTDIVAGEVERLLGLIAPRGAADLRLELAGPLSVMTMVEALGLEQVGPREALGWYADIVTEVTAITAGRQPDGSGRAAFARLRAAVEPALDRDPTSSLVAAAAGDAGGLTRREVASNAAVLLFGGIETTEAMIANAFAHLLAHDDQRSLVERDPALVPSAVEESLRLEPAAAVIDRYATRDVELGGAALRRGDLVTLSLAGANRDPAVFDDPDRFDVRRENARLQVAFAHGPHVCLGMHLARLETCTAVARSLERLPGLRLDPARPPLVRGLVFRKPDAVHVVWDRCPAGPPAPVAR